MNKFLVWCPDLGITANDGKVIEALDAEEAAKSWAEYEDYNSGDYWIVGGGNTPMVIVRHVDSGVDTKFFVSGEMVYQYSAKAIE